ncbi:MAG: hypothetical protein IJO19_01970, partial [Clostridia bacterium]|nr:hypothetical protein [Clostridia bacterium]
TNSKFLLENANELSNKYINRFAFINKHLPIGDLLYFTDCLITNQPNYATAFSATEKNLFCLSQINNNLEKYMKKEFPKLYIDNMNSFDITKLLSNELSNEFKKVSKLFNVQSDKNPYEVIADIIKKDS